MIRRHIGNIRDRNRVADASRALLEAKPQVCRSCIWTLRKVPQMPQICNTSTPEKQNSAWHLTCDALF